MVCNFEAVFEYHLDKLENHKHYSDEALHNSLCLTADIECVYLRGHPNLEKLEKAIERLKYDGRYNKIWPTDETG